MSDLEPILEDVGPAPMAEPVEDERVPVSRVGLVAAIVVLLAGAGFALAYLAPQSNTPEDAVRGLAQAISDEDVVGILDSLAPSERRLVKDFVIDMVEELERVDVLEDDVDLSGLSGVDVEIEDLQLSEERLGDGVSLVTVTGGRVDYTVAPKDLPLGSLARDALAESEGTELEPQRSSEPIGETALVVVQEDGRWHVSLFYSAADAIRRDADQPPPRFGGGPAPDGKDSPEEAVRAMIDAGVQLDPRRAISLLPPDEGKVVRDYSSLFLDDLERAAVDARRAVRFTVDDLQLDTELDGDQATVNVTNVSASYRSDDDGGSVRYDGECMVFSGADGEEFDSCDARGRGGLGMAPFGMADGLGFVTVERAGKWYVSPVRTVLESTLRSIREVEPDEVEDFFGAFPASLVAAESSETLRVEADVAQAVPVRPARGSSDSFVQAQLRTALVMARTVFIENGETWTDDPAALNAFNLPLVFERLDGIITTGVVDVAVQGDTIYLASRGEGACFYIAAQVSGSAGYATDPSCRPPTVQSYDPAGWG